MRISGSTARTSSTIFILVLLSLCVSLRFLHLDADFPLGISWSGDLYTDEGWYANAAVRETVSGKWYLPGDFNPAVNLPVGQMLQRAAFGAFGLSLVSARIPEALAYSATILLVLLIVRRDAGLQAGLLAALILSSSYIGFAYSRLAIMEPIGMLFVAAALLLAQRAQGRDAGRGAVPWLILSALSVAAAVLVKGTMIFAVPVIAWVAWHNGSILRERLMFAALAVLTSCLVIAGWQLLARHFFYADYTYFNRINLGSRQVRGIPGWFGNIIYQARSMLILGKLFLAASAILTVGAALSSAAYRRKPVVQALAGYLIAYFGLLTLVRYGPPRYFLPMVVPLAGLAGIACVDLADRLRSRSRHRRFAALPFLLVAVMVSAGCLRDFAYIARPHYSFLRMTEGIRQAIGRREKHLSDVVLLGNMADSVALETGMQAVNARLGTLPLDERLRRHRPSYVVVHTDEQEVIGSIRALGGRPTRLGAWDVYENYYGGQKVRLFRVDWDR